jgi:hypothetical protein
MGHGGDGGRVGIGQFRCAANYILLGVRALHDMVHSKIMVSKPNRRSYIRPKHSFGIGFEFAGILGAMGKPSMDHWEAVVSAGVPAIRAYAEQHTAKAGGGQKQVPKATGGQKKETKAAGKGGAEPKSKVKAEAKAGAEPKPKAKSVAKAGAEPKPKAKAGAEPKPKAKAGAEPKPKAKAGAEPKPKAKANHKEVVKGEKQVAKASAEYVATPCRKRAKKEIDQESDQHKDCSIII